MAYEHNTSTRTDNRPGGTSFTESARSQTCTGTLHNPRKFVVRPTSELTENEIVTRAEECILLAQKELGPDASEQEIEVRVIALLEAF